MLFVTEIARLWSTSQFDKLLGPATANMKLFDILKDANGEINPDELKLFFTAQKKTQEVG